MAFQAMTKNLGVDSSPSAQNNKKVKLFVSLGVTEKDNTPYQPPLAKGRLQKELRPNSEPQNS